MEQIELVDVGEHLGEGPLPLREWHGGQDVVQSEMVKAHLTFLRAVGSHRRV